MAGLDAAFSTLQPTVGPGRHAPGSFCAGSSRCFCRCRREKTTCKPERSPSGLHRHLHIESPSRFFPALRRPDRGRVQPLCETSAYNVFGIRISLFSCFTEPLERLPLIGYSEPEVLLESHAKPELRLGYTFFRRAPHRALVLQQIPVCTLTADPIPCGRVTLFSRLLIPVGGFLIIKRKKSARLVNPAEPVLGLRITGFSHGEKRLPVARLQGGQT